jgi:hypothetical protein
VAEEGSSTPRRALGPLPDEPEDVGAGGRFGSRAALPDDEPSPPTSTGRLRRLALSPLSPEDPLDVKGSTPVPPPMPVLPDHEGGFAPATGRRYSASIEPNEVAYAAPRRSAASPFSPASAVAPILPPVVRPTAPPPVTVPAPSLPPPPPITAAVTSPALTSPALTSPALTSAALTSAALTTAALTTESRQPTPSGTYPQSVATAPTAPTDAPALTPPAAAAGRSLFGRAVTKPKPAPTEAEAALGREPRLKKEPKPKPEPKLREEPKPKRSADAGTEAAPAGAGLLKDRSAKPALIVIAAVAAVVVLVAATVWALTLRSTAPSGGPSATGTAAALDPLLTAADLGSLGATSWVDPDPTASADSARPLCLPAEADGLPEAQRSVSRKLSASSSPTDSVVQVVDTYADTSAATQAYAARLLQAGTCADEVALITGASTVTGLADSAEVIRLTVQEQTDQFHSLLLTRTGRSISLIDVTTAAVVTASDLANVAAHSLNRQCGGELGTCPGSIAVAPTPPPPGNPMGWLLAADLPRITPGAGRWAGTEPETALNVIGSQCEALNLKAVTGTDSAAQRTLLLADDASAPDGFGVDQVVYTFSDAAGAQSLAKKLDKNLSGCPDRAPTASVNDGPAVKGSGTASAAISGTTYLVTQKTETNTVLFRVAVLTVGNRLVYLLANPSTSFDFSDGDWAKLAVRSGQRVSQSS